MSQVTEGNLDASGHKFAIVVSRFNSFITDRLLAGALDALKRSGVKPDDVEIVKVPGSWELPLAAKTLAAKKQHAAIIALGAVIRGETPGSSRRVRRAWHDGRPKPPDSSKRLRGNTRALRA